MLYAWRIVATIVSRVGRNAVPFAAVFAWDWQPINALWLYLGENVVAMILGALAFWIVSPPDGVIERETVTRGDVLKGFLLVAGGFTLVTAVIAAVAIGAREEFFVNVPELLRALGMMFLFQIAGFTVHLGRPKASLTEANQLLEKTVGRVVLLAFAVWLGLLLGFVFAPAFVIPFMVMKAIADLWGVRPEALKRRVMFTA